MDTKKVDLNLLDDLVIWSRIKTGDNDALGQLYDKYINELMLYGISVSNDKDQVMDCIHDLFVDLYKYRFKLSDTDNIKYYLFSSLKRKIFKKGKKAELSLDDHNSLFHKYSLKNHDKSIEENIINSETVKEKSLRLIKGLNSLTKKQREGLSLRFDQERSYEEIAHILNISVASARTTIYRAIKLLRDTPFLLLLFIKNLFF